MARDEDRSDFNRLRKKRDWLTDDDIKLLLAKEREVYGENLSSITFPFKLHIDKNGVANKDIIPQEFRTNEGNAYASMQVSNDHWITIAREGNKVEIHDSLTHYGESYKQVIQEMCSEIEDLDFKVVPPKKDQKQRNGWECGFFSINKLLDLALGDKKNRVKELSTKPVEYSYAPVTDNERHIYLGEEEAITNSLATFVTDQEYRGNKKDMDIEIEKFVTKNLVIGRSSDLLNCFFDNEDMIRSEIENKMKDTGKKISSTDIEESVVKVFSTQLANETKFDKGKKENIRVSEDKQRHLIDNSRSEFQSYIENNIGRINEEDLGIILKEQEAIEKEFVKELAKNQPPKESIESFTKSWVSKVKKSADQDRSKDPQR
jgi:hypothetical protein